MARNMLKAGRGFEFVKKGRGAMLRRAGGVGGGAGVSFSCACHSSETGKCKVVIEPDGSSIGCEKTTCTGSCKWEVNIPGLSRAMVTVAARRG